MSEAKWHLLIGAVGLVSLSLGVATCLAGLLKHMVTDLAIRAVPLRM